MRTTEDIMVLIVAFVLFAGGVYALSMDRGDGRTLVLGGVVVAMLCLAVRQTFKRMGRKK